MKNLKGILLALTLGLTTLTSCSSDDNSSDKQIQPQPQNELLGKWNLEKADMKLVIDGEILIDEKDVAVSEQGLVNHYEFFDNNTFEYYIYNPTEVPAIEESANGTYTRNGDKLTITFSDRSNTYTVKLLDSNNLHLNISDEETVEGVNYSMDVTQKFVKMK